MNLRKISVQTLLPCCLVFIITWFLVRSICDEQGQTVLVLTLANADRGYANYLLHISKLLDEQSPREVKGRVLKYSQVILRKYDEQLYEVHLDDETKKEISRLRKEIDQEGNQDQAAKSSSAAPSSPAP